MIITEWIMPNYEQINDYFQHSENIIIYNNGESFSFGSDTANFDLIIDTINKMCHNSHEMPAFGVALNNETSEAIKSGHWIEFIFNQEYYHKDMPFSRLILNVNSEYSGFNIIRYHNGEYSGRCYYLDLTQDMSSLNDTLENIIDNIEIKIKK